MGLSIISEKRVDTNDSIVGITEPFKEIGIDGAPDFGHKKSRLFSQLFSFAISF